MFLQDQGVAFKTKTKLQSYKKYMCATSKQQDGFWSGLKTDVISFLVQFLKQVRSQQLHSIKLKQMISEHLSKMLNG